MDTNLWRFLSASLAGDRLENLFCATEFIPDGDAGLSNSSFNVFHAEEWFAYETEASWSASAMTALFDSVAGRWVVLALGSNGDFWELLPKGPSEATGRIADCIGLAQLATVAGQAYACGMGRRCLRRLALGSWEDISAPWPAPEEGVVGFTAIAGDSDGRLYAAGWGGEIWCRDRDAWTKLDSITNSNLNALAFAADGSLYCAGDRGTLMRLHEDEWELIESGTEQDLYGLCWHEEQMFVCSLSEVFRVADGGLVRDFANGSDAPRSCLRLLSDGNGHLYSVGPSDVFRRQSEGWERLA